MTSRRFHEMQIAEEKAHGLYKTAREYAPPMDAKAIIEKHYKKQVPDISKPQHLEIEEDMWKLKRGGNLMMNTKPISIVVIVHDPFEIISK
jgi:hypothetical protein